MSRSIWHKLSIRWQLIVLLSLVLSVVGAVTFGITYWFDIKERKTLALEQVDTLTRALQHDLVKALVNPQADVYADISFRLSGFETLAGLALMDANGKEIFMHRRDDAAFKHDILRLSDMEPHFTDDFLYIRKPLEIEGYRFGEVAQVVDLAGYRTGLKEMLSTLLSIYAIELGICLLLAIWIGRSYTRPFTVLADAMHRADVKNNQFPKADSDEENEIGVLYRGYNELVNEITKVTSHLKYTSEHDSLTDLYNRYALEHAANQCLHDEKYECSVLMALDIDQFKLVNDNAGHVAGDELLKHIGRILLTNSSPEAVIARTGGDDFKVLLAGVNEQEAIKQAHQLMNTLREYRFPWDADIFSVSACVGLVAFRPCEYTLESLLTAVETAFYAAKAKGHNHLHVYRPDDDTVQQYSADIVAAAMIREALDSGPSQFELYAQAIVPLQYNHTQTSYEVLLRLRNGKGELVRPDHFLPTANRYQLMLNIDIHVFWSYLQTVTASPEHLNELGFVNINLAGATLNDTLFQEKLKQAIEYFDFPWHKMVLEVTETSAIGNLAKASGFIEYCRAMGIKVALDDFGTGMASFEYLKFLPLDIVKIDGSFVRDMLSDPIDHAMVSYTHEISKLRGQLTIAEFIENETQLKALREIGIDYGQGYYLGEPRPLQQWLASAEHGEKLQAQAGV